MTPTPQTDQPSTVTGRRLAGHRLYLSAEDVIAIETEARAKVQRVAPMPIDDDFALGTPGVYGHLAEQPARPVEPLEMVKGTGLIESDADAYRPTQRSAYPRPDIAAGYGAQTDFQREVVQRNIDLTNMVLALREALERVMADVRGGYEVGIGATGQAIRVLSDTASAEAEAVAQIEKPWREVVKALQERVLPDGICWCSNWQDGTREHEWYCVDARALLAPASQEGKAEG